MSTLKQREKIVYSDVVGFMDEFIGDGMWHSLGAVYWNTADFVIFYFNNDMHYDYSTFVNSLWDEYETEHTKPKQVNNNVLTVKNQDSIEWSPKTRIDISGGTDEYRLLVQRWYDYASSDEFYAEFINNKYGHMKGFVKEIEKSLDWLIVNTNNRRKDLDAYLRGWLDRWSKKQ